MSSSSFRSAFKSFCLILFFITGAVTVTELAALTPLSGGAQGSKSQVGYFSRISPTPIACDRNRYQWCSNECFDRHLDGGSIDPRNSNDPRVQGCRRECQWARC